MATGKGKQRQVLEVEDEEERRERLERLLAAQTSNKGTPQFPFTLPKDKNGEILPISSQVLARVQAFLPEMERANAELEQRTKTEPSSVVIENNTSGSGEYIEMNLGLGVFEQRKRERAAQAATQAPPNTEGDIAMEDGTDSDSESEESDSESDSDSSTSNSDSDGSSDSGFDLMALIAQARSQQESMSPEDHIVLRTLAEASRSSSPGIVART